MLHTSSTTADAYARTVALCADQPAVSTPSRQLTYRELDAAASALAAQLRLDGKPMGLCLAVLTKVPALHHMKQAPASVWEETLRSM